ncbi:MAG: GYD domain-containing protein [Acidimicrobiales bacterium]|jgi:uncharacterized protein with GYD domain|nr:GYD domain-containing protein [Acidimicrobiales bacterium]
MAHTQLSRTRAVPEAWEGLSQEENDAQSAAIYEAIARNGGEMKAVGVSPSAMNMASIVEYPDEASAQRSVAEIMALGTLEFVSIETLWDLGSWTAMLREANNAS